jgi:hypothetical protein
MFWIGFLGGVVITIIAELAYMAWEMKDWRM